MRVCVSLAGTWSLRDVHHGGQIVDAASRYGYAMNSHGRPESEQHSVDAVHEPDLHYVGYTVISSMASLVTGSLVDDRRLEVVLCAKRARVGWVATFSIEGRCHPCFSLIVAGSFLCRLWIGCRMGSSPVQTKLARTNLETDFSARGRNRSLFMSLLVGSEWVDKAGPSCAWSGCSRALFISSVCWIVFWSGKVEYKIFERTGSRSFA